MIVRADYTTTPEQEVLAYAKELANQKPDWVTFFREILGPIGLASTIIPTSDINAFRQSPEHDAILCMVAELRNPQPEPKSEERVVTVRLPKEMHESLKEEAHASRISLNSLCVTKLLEPLKIRARTAKPSCDLPVYIAEEMWRDGRSAGEILSLAQNCCPEDAEIIQRIAEDAAA